MFYQRLNLICKSKGTTVTAMVKELGLSTANLSNWKNGRLPKTEIAFRIANYLGVSVYELMGENDKKNSPDEPKLTEGEKIWLDLYHQLSNETRTVLVNMANAFESLPCDRQKFLLDAIRFAVENQK